MKNPPITRLASALMVGHNPINDERKNKEVVQPKTERGKQHHKPLSQRKNLSIKAHA